MRTCSRCNLSKPIDEYPRDGQGYRLSKCRPCRNLEARARTRIKKRLRSAEHWFAIDLKRRYGITAEEYLEIERTQEYVCAICKQEDHVRLAIDHDHITGKVRGLLCYHCNRALGMMRDNIEWIENMVAYLKQHAAEKEQPIPSA